MCINTREHQEARFYTGFLAALRLEGGERIHAEGDNFAPVAKAFNGMQQDRKMESFPLRIHPVPITGEYPGFSNALATHGWLKANDRHQPTAYSLMVSMADAREHLETGPYSEREREALKRLAGIYLNPPAC